MSNTKILVGHIYRAKNPKPCFVGHIEFFNDRQVTWIGLSEVQYDSPTVRNGRKYPKVSIEKFKAWMGDDVTEQMPELEWMPYKKRGAA